MFGLCVFYTYVMVDLGLRYDWAMCLVCISCSVSFMFVFIVAICFVNVCSMFVFCMYKVCSMFMICFGVFVVCLSCGF